MVILETSKTFKPLKPIKARAEPNRTGKPPNRNPNRLQKKPEPERKPNRTEPHAPVKPLRLGFTFRFGSKHTSRTF